MNRADKLKEAESIIREVRSTLNKKGKPCECCDRTTYENWDEYQMYDRLTAAIKRCDTVAEWVARKGLMGS